MENTVLLDTVRTNLDRLTKQTSTGELPLLAQLEDAMFPSGESGGGGRALRSRDALRRRSRDGLVGPATTR